MRAVDVIRRKRDGAELSAEEIGQFVTGATTGSWADYQASALLMAIVLRGMSRTETIELTRAMVDSGERLDLSEFGGIPVDKHSTGGVGDKLSLVIAPLVAACGGLVPMMSGRGLGHTGGTLDKLESIPGFRTQLTLDEMRRVLRTTGCALIGQTREVAPADRKLYALRDVTSTVESIPLICASILSKKIAEGIGGLVLDVKVGPGAFMKTHEDARELAQWLTSIATGNGVRTCAFLTPMSTPLGLAVGNANEVVESAETLKGRGPRAIEDLSVALSARMLVFAGLADNDDEATAKVRKALEDGRGFERFLAIVEAQGGDPRALEDYKRLPQPGTVDFWRAPAAGTIVDMNAELIGRASVGLGAGRSRAEEDVDPAAGIDVLVPVGAGVKAGEPVLRLMARDADRVDAARPLLQNAVRIGDQAPDPQRLILEVVTAG